MMVPQQKCKRLLLTAHFLYTKKRFMCLSGSLFYRCWISDAVVHQGVNVGYYAIVFIFTLSIFIITVRQIVLLNSTARKTRDQSSIKTNSFSILGLFLMFGITWAFAFFSHGPLLIASYYIFTILNSFQGTLTQCIQTVSFTLHWVHIS